jgi:UDP-2-acetamido-3-amino-2,3-dideoxy-glucuronate N-acetyltransferase
MVFTNVINPRSHVERKHEYRRTLVKQGASIGANATIVCGTTLGRYSFVAAGAVVTKDVPDYALVMGVPAIQAGWMCACGIRLPEGEEVECSGCGRCYQIEEGHCKEFAPVTIAKEEPELFVVSVTASQGTASDELAPIPLPLAA